MKIYRLQSIGSIDGLVMCEEPTPEPGPGEVLVNIKATSLNFRDLTIINGWSPFPPEEGRVQLSDAAGVIEAVGPGVTRFAVGDRVANNFMPGWHAGPFREFGLQFGTQMDGWMAEYRTIHQNELVVIPDSISFEDAATLPCAAVTAWNAVAGVGPQHRVLIQGTGGVSVFALQFAKARGAQVIATTSSNESPPATGSPSASPSHAPLRIATPFECTSREATVTAPVETVSIASFSATTFS